MLDQYISHNRFKEGLNAYLQADPHLLALSKLAIQYSPQWWQQLDLRCPGIYILTGGRQIGKSTSCKLLIRECLEKKLFPPSHIFYLTCDEIIDAKALSNTLRSFLNDIDNQPFLLIIDEVTYVKNWDRAIKALADEGYFRIGLCILTGSDTFILKEAAMRFPGRRGEAAQTDFHLYPLSFAEYTTLLRPNQNLDEKQLSELFQQYLISGGYLRAINDVASDGKIKPATYATYEQWIRGDALKQGKSEDTLLAVLKALYITGVSQISYSKLTQKIGLISKETCIDYCNLLERMDVLIHLKAFDQNKKQGFPRKDRKFHFTDPFIQHTLFHWLNKEGYINTPLSESELVEACVASHCHRLNKTFYFKSQGEVDVIWLDQTNVTAIEVKWGKQASPNDLKTLKQFSNRILLTKQPTQPKIDETKASTVYQFLNSLTPPPR